MRILLIGASGLLGNELKKVFNDHTLYVLSRDLLDITDFNSIHRAVEHTEPEVIINTAGFTDVDSAETQKEKAMLLNGTAVGYLAEAAKMHSAILVHFSTDYIFDGTKKEGYLESDITTTKPVNVYGASKLFGEQLLQKNTDRYYLIRTSWLFGKNGKNFVDTMINLGNTHKELDVVCDQFGKPTYTVDLSKAVKQLLTENMPFGFYNIVNEKSTNWYDYACTIFKLYGKAHKWNKDKYPIITPVSSEQFSAKANRPQYSILNNTKFPKLRPWEKALEEYIGTR